jgi:formylglycine-generating enzyme
MACCVPERLSEKPIAGTAPQSGCVGPGAPPALIAIPAGAFTMGNDGPDAVAGDGEGPARRVSLSAFEIAPATVTNAEFADFVRATRYVSEAEREGSSFVFYLQVGEEERNGVRQVAAGLPWWLAVEDACWQRPEGPGTHIYERLDHPVVHVSWNDAQAYCAWAGVRLPSEAQWECAARGGFEGRRFPWGNELLLDGVPTCNVWRGSFPNAPAEGWRPSTMPAVSGPANGFSLHNTCGNVWEWCADDYDSTYHRTTAQRDPIGAVANGRRVMRGGSFLCHDSYCNRYRLAARNSNTPSSAASNIGFRVAR